MVAVQCKEEEAEDPAVEAGDGDVDKVDEVEEDVAVADQPHIISLHQWYVNIFNLVSYLT